MPALHDWAQAQPDKVAIHMADGSGQLTYRELDERANRVAQWLISLGLQPGATVGLLLENHLHTFELWWGARRAGLYYVPLSTHLKGSEIAYVLRDCQASALIASGATASLAVEAFETLRPDELPHRYLLEGEASGFASYLAALEPFSGTATLPERAMGREFMYSSGTTGFPKGIRRALAPFDRRRDLPLLEQRLRAIFRFDAQAIYLSTSPLYHALGRFNIRTIECGGTCVIMGKFDALLALQAIERYRVTHSHWVPTMLVRLLALPAEVRQGHDVSSMQCAIHATAPCAVHVKRAMIEWWGPVIEEYYGGSENVGVTHIDGNEWLAHPGSVGRPICGTVHIVSEENPDIEIPAGEIGMVYFDGGVAFEYHNDQGKTRQAFNSRGWGTYGDLGSLDAEGFLYLSDRRTDLIISGGVNIYPREVENVLDTHPSVAESAVIGVPNEEYGQEVKAVVQLKAGVPETSELAEALMALCREKLSRLKCPRSVDFTQELPRNENGKLLKRVLREAHLKAASNPV
ncbi:AMP-binding protein [Ottowia thiooxydans]|uniref:AMP-binding protein n=1 Tax=Ottowia thiooxydans TaxID=219182 RepID=UPI000428ABD9|nr:AMP-binding protein [Ottowia thiooxydans]